jgi:hypothetical protein
MLCVYVQVGVQNTLGIWPYHINQEVPMIEMEYTHLLLKKYRAHKSRSSNHFKMEYTHLSVEWVQNWISSFEDFDNF